MESNRDGLIVSLKIIIKSLKDKNEEEGKEYSFDQEVVRIGRKDLNDIQLRDARRLVSGQHAEIRTRGLEFILVDLGSRNGTRLNEELLDSQKDYSLKEKDQISIGDFIIECYPVIQEAESILGQEPSTDSTMFLSEVPLDPHEVIEDLNRAYWENIDCDAEERKGHLLKDLRGSLAGMDQSNALKMLDLIESHYPEPRYQEMRIQERSSQGLSTSSLEEFDSYKACYEGLMEIAEKYLDDPEGLKDPVLTRQFIDRIKVILGILMNSLAVAVKGRKQFEEEFDVEATQIFSWKPNPIKFAQDGQEVGKYLLDSKGEEGSAEKAASDLEEVFQDLALHQMGLMAGFKRCLRGLLAQLDPRTIQKESDREFQSGPLKIARSFPPVSNWLAWNQYRKKHQELSEQEVKTFETILGPEFAKGYLSIQKKKTS